MPPRNASRPLNSLPEPLGLHVAGQGLERMQAVDPGLDQPVDHPVYRTAGVEHHLVAVPMSLFREPADPREDEPFELPRPADQALLGAEIVAEEVSRRPGHRPPRRTARWPRSKTRTPCPSPRSTTSGCVCILTNYSSMPNRSARLW